MGTMSKERRTVSLDPEVDDHLSKDGVNASELVNKLVRTHATAGGSDRAMLELREQQLESELADLESRTERKRQELEQVREQLAEYRDAREDIIAEARNTLTREQYDPANEAVKTWAEKAEMSPEAFVDALLEEPT
jgi:chromosome segregation ATPase